MRKRVSIICVIAMVAFLCQILIRGVVPSMVYYTYHFSYYKLNPNSYIMNLSNFLSIFLIIACGIFKICYVKRIIHDFILIQPIKLVMDFVVGFLYDKFNVSLFDSCSSILITIILVYCVDLYVIDKSTFKANMKKNKKPLIKALIICILMDLLRYLVSYTLTTLISSLAVKIVDDIELSRISICCLIIDFAITLLLITLGTILLIKLFSRICIYQENEDCVKHKITGSILMAVAIVLMVVSTTYYSTNSVNPILYYLSFF